MSTVKQTYMERFRNLKPGDRVSDYTEAGFSTVSEVVRLQPGPKGKIRVYFEEFEGAVEMPGDLFFEVLD